MMRQLPPAFDMDEIYPRDEENRYRIYAIVGDERTILATTDCAAGVGLALVTLHEDQKKIGRRLADHGRIGLLDTMPGSEPSPTGEWIIIPWDRPSEKVSWTDPETGRRTPLGEGRHRGRR